ncbi:MAG: hypothetical protein E7256_16290 [Lachnospiraceae bacterium]|nr:hypothetical protein [Lachnospiraceae bacterium]
MFGYVTIHKPELKVREYEAYRAYYCGLCHVLKERYGRFGQMTLTYDMTFLVIFLNSLYEQKMTEESHRCLAHPTKKHLMYQNTVTEYAADMNIALTYHKMMDDWNDERKVTRLAYASFLKRDYKRIEKQYPKQCKAIETALHDLAECEKKGSMNLDEVSGHFGTLMSALFLYKEDVWKNTLQEFGFYLGKYIYLIDAFEDVKEDIKQNHYNPMKELYKNPDFNQMAEEILTMMMAECTKAFERLPIIQDAELLRNILYAGVWTKFVKIEKKDMEEHTD